MRAARVLPLAGSLAVLLLVTRAHAAGAAYPISIETTTDGAEQERFAYQIRERIRASNTFKYVANGSAGFRLRVNMMSGPTPVSVIVYSYALSFAVKEANGTVDDYFLWTLPGYCGLQITETCAESIVARAAQQAETLVDELNKPSAGFH